MELFSFVQHFIINRYRNIVTIIMKHISIRVPWHDNKWNGTICKCPKNNPFCKTLHKIAESKNTDKEQMYAGKDWSEVDQTMPVCKGENGGFMNTKAYKRTFKHIYSWNEYSPHHNLRPTTIEVSPYTFWGIPFRYMSRDTSKELDLKYPNFAKDEPAPFATSWTYGAQRQKDILNWFSSNIKPNLSLAVLYCKNGNPIDEECGRIIIGMGEVSKVHNVILYDTDMSTKYPVWDLMMEHTIRPDLKKSRGFLLPYKEYLELDDIFIKEKTGKSKQVVIEEIKLSLKELDNNQKIFQELSYGCEYLSNHSMLIILNAAKNCIEKIIKHGLIGGDWKRQIRWIDEQISKVKDLIGPFPAFAEALRAIGIDYAYIIEQDLRNYGFCNIKDNPWESFKSLLKGTIRIENICYKSELSSYKLIWDSITDESKEILELLSRFEINSDTIKYWYRRIQSYTNLLANPYIISEASIYLNKDIITTEMIDLGVIADPQIQGMWTPKSPYLIDSKIDKRRIRSLITSKLNSVLVDGDTLLSVEEIEKHIEDSLSKDNLSLPVNYLLTIKDFITETLILLNSEEGISFQLKKYYEIEKHLRKTFSARASKSVKKTLNEDWESLVKSSIIGYDENNVRSRSAAEDQIRALKMFSEKRLSVLSGPAGTGKTTIVRAFLNSQQILNEGVLLLAPTGKARVKLGNMSNGLEAKTIAQFLTQQGFFNWDIMQPYIPKNADEIRYTGARNIIVDECSMLTCMDFYALLKALDLKYVYRIILIGDPYQLPPIGSGRVFSDLFNYLNNSEEKQLRSAITQLRTVVRTIKSGESDILSLASWFTGTKPSKDADNIFEKIYKKELEKDLSIYVWKNETELKEKLQEVLVKELPNSSCNLGYRIKSSIGLDNITNAVNNPEVIENFQVLSPVVSPMWGTHQLNSYFQEWSGNSYSKYFIEISPERLYYGDKVIQLINEKREGYPSAKKTQLSNGQIGFIRFVDYKNKIGKVVFTGIPNQTFTYNSSLSDEKDAVLELAYAITIHKSQGSDFDTVLVVLPKTGRILSRELIYTALTRAKSKLILLVEDNTSWLMEFTKPQASILAKRNSNLFKYSVRKDNNEIPFVEGLIHKTLKPNLIVRSKSEVIIANLLYERGIKFEYEKMIKENGKCCIPDFTLEDASGDIIIWEHLGMLDNPAYKESWEKKLRFYKSIGFIEGENLFTTIDHENGAIDSMEIVRTINKLEEIL